MLTRFHVSFDFVDVPSSLNYSAVHCEVLKMYVFGRLL